MAVGTKEKLIRRNLLPFRQSGSFEAKGLEERTKERMPEERKIGTGLTGQLASAICSYFTRKYRRESRYLLEPLRNSYLLTRLIILVSNANFSRNSERDDPKNSKGTKSFHKILMTWQ